MMLTSSAAPVDAWAEGSPVASPVAVNCDDVRSAMAKVGEAFANHQTATRSLESLEDDPESILTLTPDEYLAVAEDTAALAEDIQEIGAETPGIAGEWITASAFIFEQLAGLFRTLADETDTAGKVAAARTFIARMEESVRPADALEAEIEAACGVHFRIEADGTVVEEPLAATPTP
jgi:hypothetical protein